MDGGGETPLLLLFSRFTRREGVLSDPGTLQSSSGQHLHRSSFFLFSFFYMRPFFLPTTCSLAACSCASPLHCFLLCTDRTPFLRILTAAEILRRFRERGHVCTNGDSPHTLLVMLLTSKRLATRESVCDEAGESAQDDGAAERHQEKGAHVYAMHAATGR